MLLFPKHPVLNLATSLVLALAELKRELINLKFYVCMYIS